MGASGTNHLAFFLVPPYTSPPNLARIGVTLGGPWDKRDGRTDGRTLPLLGQPPGTGKNLKYSTHCLKTKVGVCFSNNVFRIFQIIEF